MAHATPGRMASRNDSSGQRPVRKAADVADRAHRDLDQARWVDERLGLRLGRDDARQDLGVGRLARRSPIGCAGYLLLTQVKPIFRSIACRSGGRPGRR